MTETWWGKNEDANKSKDPKVEHWQFKGHGREWLAQSKENGEVKIKVVGKGFNLSRMHILRP